MVAPQAYGEHLIAKEVERNRKSNNLQVVSLILFTVNVVGAIVLILLVMKSQITVALALSMILAPVLAGLLYVNSLMRKTEADK